MEKVKALSHVSAEEEQLGQSLTKVIQLDSLLKSIGDPNDETFSDISAAVTKKMEEALGELDDRKECAEKAKKVKMEIQNVLRGLEEERSSQQREGSGQERWVVQS